ncbi:uncharacterized protein PAC_01201 [Phialocephala subalpina]|uniref:Uncharacterized protein n=1 Tax=Phialocephala subalpina TaxID=576137 RepID=A0A1L7WEZ8_9HELO|nr:uncharacterized protein PAC_01201 [Phialocephala subalpina]
MDGKTATSDPAGPAVQFAMYPTSYYAFWFSAGFWNNAPAERNCSNTRSISKDECENTLNAAMIACDPNSGASHGASLAGTCIQYNITLSTDTDPQNPPWNPLPQSSLPVCDTLISSGVNNNLFAGLYPQFCSLIDGGDKTLPAGSDFTNADFKAPSKRSLDPRTPPASNKEYDGSKFHFKWTGSSGTCGTDFSRAYQSIMTSTCGNSGSESNAMTLRGSVNVGCGTYTFSIENPADEPPPTPESNCNGTSDGYYVSGASIYANYPDFCTKIPDKVDIAVTFPGDDGTLYPQVSADDCNNATKGFLDTCNVAGDTNPLKYKNGEKKSQRLGAKQQLKTCQVVRSPSTPSSTPSALSIIVAIQSQPRPKTRAGYDADSGDALLHIRSCGAVTGWSFQYYASTPTDPNNHDEYEWHASGKLPIGQQQWSCIGKAISAASNGGTGGGGCSGQ